MWVLHVLISWNDSEGRESSHGCRWLLGTLSQVIQMCSLILLALIEDHITWCFIITPFTGTFASLQTGVGLSVLHQDKGCHAASQSQQRMRTRETEWFDRILHVPQPQIVLRSSCAVSNHHGDSSRCSPPLRVSWSSGRNNTVPLSERVLDASLSPGYRSGLLHSTLEPSLSSMLLFWAPTAYFPRVLQCRKMNWRNCPICDCFPVSRVLETSGKEKTDKGFQVLYFET